MKATGIYYAMQFLQTWQQKQKGDDVPHEELSAKGKDFDKKLQREGLCVGLVVSICGYYSDELSSNSADIEIIF